MNKQEAIKELQKQARHHCGEIECYKDGCEKSVELSKAINIISKIDEPKKPVVPKFVAEWIENHKEDYNRWDKEARADFVFRAIYELFRFGEELNTVDFTIDEKFSEWTTKNAYNFIIAILFEYTVEKEPLYTVEIPNPNSAGGKLVLFKQQSTGRLS